MIGGDAMPGLGVNAARTKQRQQSFGPMSALWKTRTHHRQVGNISKGALDVSGLVSCLWFSYSSRLLEWRYFGTIRLAESLLHYFSSLQSVHS
jgi:hypothetical protein